MAKLANLLPKLEDASDLPVQVLFVSVDPKRDTADKRKAYVDYFNPNTRDEFKYSKFISKFNIPTDKKIILFPGRLTKWKGQIEFLIILLSLDLNNIVCFIFLQQFFLSNFFILINNMIFHNLY